MGARCRCCEQDMMLVEGCLEMPITIDGKEYPQIRYGNESLDDLNPVVRAMVEEDLKDPTHHCPDCWTKVGKFHHPGCDVERCPKCKGQLISCGCLLETAA